MELIGDILCHYEIHGADIPLSCQVHHRMAYTGTAVFIIKFLQTILPPEKVCCVDLSNCLFTPPFFSSSHTINRTFIVNC